MQIEQKIICNDNQLMDTISSRYNFINQTQSPKKLLNKRMSRLPRGKVILCDFKALIIKKNKKYNFTKPATISTTQRNSALQ